uniref:PUA domain protein n=1 Tax=Tetraselmis sp. GSL018 TaxID=582737 RepID=A0A061S4R9_9CHLO|mmetsp:Transcript_1284/g.3070  ORF Transcript_1284/g.3070 Transcript_1284/m.3070 type:complete len:186 (-) Transcript_1284:182-739(-)
MLFKKFSKDENVSSMSQIKSSVQRGIRSKICDQYPFLQDSGVIDQILPKKEAMIVAKCQHHIQVVVMKGVPLFFCERDGPWFPTLRLLHQWPNMMPKLRVDTGAIKFVLSGANIMCPGLTSPGATIHEDVGADAPVAIFGEGKEHAMAVGITKMSTKEMKEINKGIAVDNLHYLNDGLWKTLSLD